MSAEKGESSRKLRNHKNVSYNEAEIEGGSDEEREEEDPYAGGESEVSQVSFGDAPTSDDDEDGELLGEETHVMKKKKHQYVVRYTLSPGEIANVELDVTEEDLNIFPDEIRQEYDALDPFTKLKFTCPECSCGFRYTNRLFAHILSAHQKQYLCKRFPNCRWSFDDEDSKGEHEKTC